MEQTDSEQRGGGMGQWLKGGEGSGKRTCMNDSQTWTTVWELTGGAGGSQRRVEGGKLG